MLVVEVVCGVFREGDLGVRREGVEELFCISFHEETKLVGDTLSEHGPDEHQASNGGT